MVALGLTMALNGAINPKLVLFERGVDSSQSLYYGLGSKVAGVVAATVVAVVYRSYWALVAGLIVSQVSGLALSYVLKPFRPRIMWKHARELWSFSVWLTFSQIVNTLNRRFDQLLIGGIFSARKPRLLRVGQSFLASYDGRDQPSDANPGSRFSAFKHDKARFRSAFSLAQALMSAIALPVAFGWALVADPMVRLTMGEKWLPAVIMVEFIACVAGMETLSNSVRPLALAMGEPRKIFHRDAAFLLVRMPLIVIGMSEAGLLGMVCVRTVTGSIYTLANMLLVTRLIGIPVQTQIMRNLEHYFATAIMVIVVMLVRPLTSGGTDMAGLMIKIATLASVGALTYVATIFLLWKAANYPDGPEREVLRAIQKLRSLAFGRP